MTEDKRFDNPVSTIDLQFAKVLNDIYDVDEAHDNLDDLIKQAKDLPTLENNLPIG